jgi:hypothetical protein
MEGGLVMSLLSRRFVISAMDMLEEGNEEMRCAIFATQHEFIFEKLPLEDWAMEDDENDITVDLHKNPAPGALEVEEIELPEDELPDW